MGAAPSKPSSPEGESQVWKGTGPPSVSSDLLESLQSSTEVDASRAQALELQIQTRVAAELARLQEREAAALKEARDKVSEAAEAAKGAGDASRHAVSKEVEALRARLEGRRRTVREVPASVEKARGDVVRCLRENDRRPLDCYKEVEAFKEEVRKLEKNWVDRVVS